MLFVRRRNEIIKAKKKTTIGALKKGPVEATADDLPSEEDTDDEGDMDIDMNDSDEPMSSEESDMDAGDYESEEEEKEIDSDEEQDYEQAPRRAEGWSEKGSTRLPIKLADGRIKEVKDDRVRPSEVKDEEEEEEEIADSDFAEEEDEEEDEEEEEEIQEPQPEKKIPKKVQIAKKKEEMATIAQTIIADPEQNVRVATPDTFFVINFISIRNPKTDHLSVFLFLHLKTLIGWTIEEAESNGAGPQRCYQEAGHVDPVGSVQGHSARIQDPPTVRKGTKRHSFQGRGQVARL